MERSYGRQWRRFAQGAVAGAALLGSVVGVVPGEAAAQWRAGRDGDDSSRGVVYALTDDNQLLAFSEWNPGDIKFRRQVTGNTADLIGIDFRPANGRLYSVDRAGGVYTIDTGTAVATQVSQMTTTPAGTRFGFDFNPVVDRLRIVSDADQNLRVNVDTGMTTVDGNLNVSVQEAGAA